ncbi:MAG: DUF3037 domain-containing protein [Verrucomicrobia bacterium]|nr:DUF3037 domain-containing protein [Verrucomicrobiota bacterium]
MSPPTTGHYSLIQYCPDRMRLEAANIGVLLFCPERNYLQARLAPTNRRIDRFFGAEAGDLKQINAMKKILEHRLKAESQVIQDVEGLQRFAELLANEIVITEPRVMLVEEPGVELAQLYEQLVGQSYLRSLVRAEPSRRRVHRHRRRGEITTTEDTRTPAELIELIRNNGREVQEVLARLENL